MQAVEVLINGNENNIFNPAKDGDVGYDLMATSIAVKGVVLGEKVTITDFSLISQICWEEISYIEYDTGVVFAPSQEILTQIPLGLGTNEVRTETQESSPFFAQLFPRSSISNKNLVLANSVGVIDPGYRGTIRARFKYLWQPNDFGQININKIYEIGDRVAQIVFAPVVLPTLHKVYFSENFLKTERQDGGFGSTN